MDHERAALSGSRRRLPLGVVAALGVLLAPDARACDYGVDPLTVDGTKVGAPPGAAGAVSITVQRGRGPTGGCGRSSGTSCDDIGSIGLYFAPATDPDDTRQEVGYRVHVVEGAAPPGLDGLDTPQIPFFDAANAHEASLWLRWSDGATNSQEGIGFSLTITPVDVHGNEGPSSPVIRVADGGSGCAVGHAAGGGGAIAALTAVAVAGLAAARRRRRRPTR